MNLKTSGQAVVLVVGLLAPASLNEAQTTLRASTIVARAMTVGGLRIHYLTAGPGPAVLFLHGYIETSRKQDSDYRGVAQW